MDLLKSLVHLFVYPGLLFLFVYSTFVEWVDRKLYARFQNRRGPLYTGRSGLLQPIADFVKLMAKEDIVPKGADKALFTAAPIIGLAAVLTAGLLLPLWHYTPFAESATSFRGDIIVMAYLLSLPTMAYFVAGWSSASMFASLGAVRAMTLLFSYEVPLFLAFLAPAMFTGSWRMAEIAQFYQAHPQFLPINIIAFVVAIIALQAKLERLPFDIPEAETEIVGGPLTEVSGRKLAMFRLLVDIQMGVGAGFIATLFLGGFPGGPVMALIWFVIKTMFVVFILSLIRSTVARIRIDQMVRFSWSYLAPLAILQQLIIVLVRGFMQ